MRKLLRPLGYVLFSNLWVISTQAQVRPQTLGPIAEGERLDLQQNSEEFKRVPGLQWDDDSFTVESLMVDGVKTLGIKLRGTLIYAPRTRGGTPLPRPPGDLDQGFRFFYQVDKPKRIIISPKTGKFELLIPVQSRTGRITILLRTLDDLKNSYSDVVYLRRRIEDDRARLKKPFAFVVGASLSYLSYHETYGTDRFNIDEIGLTIKTSAAYRLSPNFDLGANIFVTAFPLAISKSPSGIEDSRFLGINGRIGYRLPFYSLRTSYYVMTGWYIWGQLVPGPLDERLSYGVTMLGGPQLFLMARFTTDAGRPWFTYLKFATISTADQGIFSTSNREIAIGGGYTLSTSANRRQWTLTVDLAHAQYSNSTKGFTFLSLSSGVSLNL